MQDRVTNRMAKFFDNHLCYYTKIVQNPNTQQWFNLYAPNRVGECGEEQANDFSEVNTNTRQDELQLVNHLDTNRVFKGKSDAMKPQTKLGKKKPAGSNVRTNTSTRFQGTSGFRTHR